MEQPVLEKKESTDVNGLTVYDLLSPIEWDGSSAMGDKPYREAIETLFGKRGGKRKAAQSLMAIGIRGGFGPVENTLYPAIRALAIAVMGLMARTTKQTPSEDVGGEVYALRKRVSDLETQVTDVKNHVKSLRSQIRK